MDCIAISRSHFLSGPVRAMLILISTVGVVLFFLSVLTSSILQPLLINSSASYFLGLQVPKSDIITLELPSSFNASQPVTRSPTLRAVPQLYNNSSVASVVPTPISVQSGIGVVKCDGTKYGFDLSVSSCEEVLKILPTSRNRWTCEYILRLHLAGQDSG